MSTALHSSQQPQASSRGEHDVLRREVQRTYASAAHLAAEVGTGSRVASCSPHSGLGCGSPTAFAGLSAGEWVLDLGSGAGFDCLAAAVEVGRKGRVVGIDMTPEMLHLARRHAAQAGVAIVHFLRGAIEQLPFPNETFDVVISNCVINLSAEKEQVLAEACRVLKPGGRLAVADIVATAPLPVRVRQRLACHTGCVAGATPMERMAAMLREGGFEPAQIEVEEHSRSLISAWTIGADLERYVAAARITGRKHAAAPVSAVCISI